MKKTIGIVATDYMKNYSHPDNKLYCPHCNEELPSEEAYKIPLMSSGKNKKDGITAMAYVCRQCRGLIQRIVI